MHLGGEADVRGAYCATAVAKLTGLLKKYPDLFESTAEWVASCQVSYFYVLLGLIIPNMWFSTSFLHEKRLYIWD